MKIYSLFVTGLISGQYLLNEGHIMKDPDKEKFILNSVEKIKALRKQIESARKNKENMTEVMAQVQEEIKKIKKDSEAVFESNQVNMSSEELESYLQNPSNFSKDDWSLLETIKSETDMCKKEIIKSNESEAVEDLIGKKKGRKKKTLRKKRWKGQKYI